MSVPTVTLEEAIKTVGTAPSLAPRPSGTNIRTLTKYFVKKLASIPSNQSRDHGYSGMIEQKEVYALKCNIPWQDAGDPGPHRKVDPQLNTAGQNDATVEYNFSKGVFDSEQNIRRAVIAQLNQAVPAAYRRNKGGVGTREYRATDDPKEILDDLRKVYGKLTPTEKTTMENQWNAMWNPQTPVENYFERMEDVYMLAIAHPPAYTEDQMVGKALTSVETCGLFQMALLEWNGFAPGNRNWAEFKVHFSEAYQIPITAGGGVQMHGLPLAGNMEDIQDNQADGDDSSIMTMVEQMNQIQMQSTATHQALFGQIADLKGALDTVVSTLGNSQPNFGMPPPPAPAAMYAPPAPTVPTQIGYNTAYAAGPPRQAPPSIAPPQMIPAQTMPHMPPYTAPAPPGYQQRAAVPPRPVPPPPGFQQPQPYTRGNQYGTQQQQGWGNGRGRQGRGRGRGGRYSRRALAYGRQPPQAGYQQQGQQQGRGGQNWAPNPPKPNKYYNNWNMCYSCGFDIPYWHTSKTCPQECRKPNHNEEVDRYNWEEYWKVGHTGISMKRMGKTALPINPGPQQA